MPPNQEVGISDEGEQQVRSCSIMNTLLANEQRCFNGHYVSPEYMNPACYMQAHNSGYQQDIRTTLARDLQSVQEVEMEPYEPELNAEENPHYYNSNELLYQAHLLRRARNKSYE